MAKKFKRLASTCNSVTVPDVIEGAIGDKRHILKGIFAIIMFVMVICYIATQNIAAGKACQTILGLNYNIGMLFGSLVVIIYTTFGGFKADVYTDTVQSIFVFTPLIVLPIIFYKLAGGWNMISANLATFTPQYTSLWAKTFGAMLLIMAFISNGIGLLGAPQFFTRFIAIKNERGIRYGGILSMFYVLLTYSGAVTIGILGRIIVPGLADGEKILPTLALQYLHPVAQAFVLAAIVSAIMSTSDSLLLIASSAISQDVYHTMINRDAPQSRLLFLSRVGVVTIGLLGLLTAFLSKTTIFWFTTFAWAGIASAFCPLIIAIIFTKRVSLTGAVMGIVLGFATTICWKLYVRPHFDLYEIIPAFAAAFIGIAVGNKFK
jgi:sodium/proline symporter